ncbi:MAG: hypothetical protein K2I68_01805, partial [Bacteroidales bacterium]|nr:hypothetical protein [Bacteroidales bacterium]
MKRFLSVFVMMILSAFALTYAQRTQYFCETFDSGRNTAALAENWDVDASKTFLNYLYINRGAEAGGQAPEAMI